MKPTALLALLSLSATATLAQDAGVFAVCNGCSSCQGTNEFPVENGNTQVFSTSGFDSLLIQTLVQGCHITVGFVGLNIDTDGQTIDGPISNACLGFKTADGQVLEGDKFRFGC